VTRALRDTAALAAILATPLACRREDPSRLLPGAAVAEQQRIPVRTSDLRAGGRLPDVAARNPYAGDSEGMAAGRLLYRSMNCSGCHGGAGGGGIYGGNPENIVQSILQGRPNGMPAFGGMLPMSEAWKIAAFVKSLSAEAEGARSGSDSPAIGSRRGTMTAGPR
jgi:cytochrome c oxidase cbb3-type subunit 3